MTKPNETTLLIKLPPELKASFQGLCKFRGVAVSAELRRFMADEVFKTAEGMTSNDKPQKLPQSILTIPKVLPTRKSFKDPVQADLELSTTTISALNATNKRKSTKKRKK